MFRKSHEKNLQAASAVLSSTPYQCASRVMIEVSDSSASAERRRSGGPDASPAAAASSSAAPGAAPEASSAKPVPAGQPFRCRLFRWPCLCLFGLPAGYLLVAVVSWRAPWVTLTGMEVVAASLGPLNIAGVTEISSTPASWHHVFGAFTLTGRACVHVHNPSVVPVQVSKLVGTLSINNIDASTKLEGVKLVMRWGRRACRSKSRRATSFRTSATKPSEAARPDGGRADEERAHIAAC